MKSSKKSFFRDVAKALFFGVCVALLFALAVEGFATFAELADVGADAPRGCCRAAKTRCRCDVCDCLENVRDGGADQ